MITAAVVLTLLGGALRLYGLSNQSFWNDEVYSMMACQAPLDKIQALSAMPNNSLPTYFLLLRAIVGQSDQDIEFKARLLSAVAGAVSIPVMVGLIFLWSRSAVAALAGGALLAINPMHLWYSQEARAYALMLLFGLLSLLFFEMAMRRHRWGWWTGYFLSAVIAIALHKTAILFPAVCGLWHAWQIRREWRRMGMLAIHAVILALAVTVLSPKRLVLVIKSARAHSWMTLPYTVITYVGGYSFGPSLNQIQSLGPWAALLQNRLEVAILAGVLLVLALAFAQNWRALAPGMAPVLFVTGILVVAAYAKASGYPYNVRYTLPALMGFIAMAGLLAPRAGRSPLARTALVALAAVSIVADWQWFNSPAYGKEDLRAVAQWLIDNENRERSWTVVPQYTEWPLKWYLGALGHPEIVSRLEESKQNETTSFPPIPDVLIIGRRDHIVQPDALIAAYLAAAQNSSKAESFAGFDLFARKQAP